MSTDPSVPGPGSRTGETLPVWVFIAASAALCVVGLVLNAQGDGGLAFDRSVFLSLRSADDVATPLGPEWLGGAMRDITALGSFSVIIVMTLAVVVFSATSRRGPTAAIVAAAGLGGLAVGEGVKLIFDRARPDLVPHAVDVVTHSFPSGHATASAAAYLSLAVLLARRHPDHRFARFWIVAVGILITVLVGVSRVYLGVHWPTDILAGWTLGGCWALACIRLGDRLSRSTT